MPKTKTTTNLPWQVEMTPLQQLKASPRNARTHSKLQIRQIADSMKRFGPTNPIIADDSGEIVAGHARAEAAKLVGLKHFPVIRLAHLTDAELRAYRLADNKLASNAGWDREILSIEFKDLLSALPEDNLNLDITGFAPDEIDSLMIDLGDSHDDPADDIQEPDGPIIARLGDLFSLDDHRLIVGDARDEKIFVQLMGAELADMAFLDPPYNVKVNGHVGGRGRIKHREFACASGEMTPEQFVAFLTTTLGLCARFTSDGAISYACIDWRHAGELLQAGSAAYDSLKNICVWAKTTPGQGSFYRSQHEFVFVYKRGEAPHLNTFKLGQNGRMRSNIWTYAGVNTFKTGRMDELKMHPTVKPVAMIVDAMKDVSRRGAIVLDAFAGSGSTIIAAEQIGRRAYCIEIDPQYADVAIQRWQRITRKDAILLSSGQTFDEVRAARLGSSTTKPAQKLRRANGA